VALVTGAAGFIGSHLTRALAARAACCRSTISRADSGNLAADVPFLEGRMTDAVLVADLYEAGWRLRRSIDRFGCHRFANLRWSVLLTRTWLPS
jgi:nucleoside-diphosphate-sugar epimerase